MCGRFNLRTSPEELARIFELLRTIELTPRYNIAPTQPVAVIRAASDGRELSKMKWGLIPSWAKEASIGGRMINARAETVAEKPSFRTALQRRRCLVPADGFYEWKALEGRKKQPYCIERADRRPICMAALWDTWKSPEGEKVESCAIVTTSANETMTSLHDRMPVILGDDDFDLWLDPDVRDAKAVEPFLQPCPADWLRFYAVNPIVNNARNETPDCLNPME